MMLPTMMDAAALAICAMSPTKTCKVRVSSTRYRNDPYRARVAPRFVKPVTPVFRGIAPVAKAAPAPLTFAAPAAIVPIAAAPSNVRALAPTQPPSPTVAAPRAAAQKPAAPVKPETAPLLKKPKDVADMAATKPQQHWALVGFKHEPVMFQAPFRVAVGDVVIVEADRGEHIGVVQSLTTTKPQYNVPSRIVRRANAEEVAMIDSLTEKEKEVTSAIQKTSESFGLGIRIVDVEFQMDLNKLTVFFSSRVFVDFRKLQRSLFREYRCRIWLKHWNEVRHFTPVPVNAVA